MEEDIETNFLAKLDYDTHDEEIVFEDPLHSDIVIIFYYFFILFW